MCLHCAGLAAKSWVDVGVSGRFTAAVIAMVVGYVIALGYVIEYVERLLTASSESGEPSASGSTDTATELIGFGERGFGRRGAGIVTNPVKLGDPSMSVVTGLIGIGGRHMDIVAEVARLGHYIRGFLEGCVGARTSSGLRDAGGVAEDSQSFSVA
jgi:hypothetical protein